MKYHGEIVQAFGQLDVMFNAQVSIPVLNNFFGFGNTTVIDESKPIIILQGAVQICGSRCFIEKKILWKAKLLWLVLLFIITGTVMRAMMIIY